jgi:hypothetical protein
MEDSISTSVPDDPDSAIKVPASIYHPCSVRGINQGRNAQPSPLQRQKDLHYLAEQCQHHTHRETCYKYCKIPSDEKQCRFNLDENNFLANSIVNLETGKIDLRCLDGMVNNFNETILTAI